MNIIFILINIYTFFIEVNYYLIRYSLNKAIKKEKLQLNFELQQQQNLWINRGQLKNFHTVAFSSLELISPFKYFYLLLHINTHSI
jgi:hypothetical protein